jgi:hypothetical protein
LKSFGGRDHLLRPCADAQVLGQIHPANDSRRVDQEFRRARDVMALDAGAWMQHAVASDYFGVGIGKKRKCVTVALAKSPRYIGSVHADRHRTNAQGFELVQIFFDTPQLGVAKRSPIAAIENEQYTFGGARYAGPRINRSR